MSRLERHPLNRLLAVLALSVAGCANLRLPAIDPSGEQLFLPSPNYTTLDAQDAPFREAPQCLRPVFKAPEAPECELPPILPNDQPNPMVSTESTDEVAPRILVPGRFQRRDDIYSVHPKREEGDNQSTVTLTPRRSIAAVGTEVFFIGGVCDADGFYRVREKLEWAIGQGSVGHFVEPGKPSVGFFRMRGRLASSRAGPQPQLLSNNYALTQSTRNVQVLTRGTAKPSDDLFVLRGQSWISVTSPVEGDTYVTLMVPSLDGWQQRQEMAVIHWVDGQWTLPPPVVSETVQPVTLNTTVTRKLSATAVTGWIVRYEVINDTPATFEGGSREIEVFTDAFGNASAQVLPSDPQGGTAQVRVQVIRPAGTGGNTDRLIVGEGVTTVAWSTATLNIEVTGPTTVELNESAVYRITVTNPSQLVANESLIRAMIPTGFDYVSSTPAATSFGSRLDWSLGSIGPGEQRTIEITYRATQSGIARHCATAQLGRSPAVEHCLTTLVTADALLIKMVGPNPEVPIEVGQTITYQVEITNRGDQRLDDVLLTDRFDEGLLHREGGSPIEWPLGTLEPGQSRQIGLSFEVVAEGRHCHTLEATASGTKPARASACVTARAPARVDLSIRKTGPAQAEVGERVDFFTEVENTGESVLTNLQITDVYDPELRPVATDPQAATSDRDRVVWYLSRLDPGERRTFQVTCQALFDVPNACGRVVVQTADGIERQDEVCLPVSPRTNAPPLEPAPGALRGESAAGAGPTPADPPVENGPRARAAGNGPSAPPDANEAAVSGLEISINGRAARPNVGDQIRYLVVIRNRQQVPESNVVLTIKLAPNVNLQSYEGPVSAATNSPDWRLITMRPIRTLRAGETVEFVVLVTVNQPGEVVSRVELTSLRNPDPLIDESATMAVP